MRKTLLQFCFLMLLGTGFSAWSQNLIVAHDDVAAVAVGNAQIVLGNVMINDSVIDYDQSTNTTIKTMASLATVTLSQIQTGNPSLQLQPDGSVAIINPLPTGVYTLIYQICLLSATEICTTATASVFVNTCQADAPFLGYANPIYCNGTTVLPVYNLPAGNWTLRKTKEGVFVNDITGQGDEALVTIDSPGNYAFQLIDDGNGCFSIPVYRQIYGTPCSYNLFYNNRTYQDFNTNGLVDAGDVVNYTFTLTNNSTVDFEDITMTSSNVNLAGGPLALLPIGAINSTTFTGQHVITQLEIDAGQVITQVSASSANPATTDYAGNIFPLNGPRGFRLVAFVDTNNDGTKQPAEPVLPYAQLQYEKNDDGDIRFLHNGNAVIYENNSANTYDFSSIVSGAYAGYYTLTTPPVQNATVGIGIETYYFAFTETPFTDTYTSLVSYNNAVAGFNYTNVIRYTNASSQPVPNGTLTFVKDDALPLISVSQPGTTTTANGFSYNFTNLGPFESRSIVVYMDIPAIPAVTLGDVITHSAAISVPPGDIAPANNSAGYSATIIGSYDPNDKAESHNGKIQFDRFSANDYLTYTIRFENTGTSPALNIRITDELDSQLDETSVRLVGSSAACRMERKGSELTWRFDGINLPPAVKQTNIGQGYVAFEVKPKPGFAVGDIIPNTGSIYFDFNPAIVTNTFETEFVQALSVAAFDADAFVVYPNPTRDIIRISSKTSRIDSVQVSDLLGKTLLQKTGDSRVAELDLSNMANGIYIVRINSGRQTHTLKIVKQ